MSEVSPFLSQAILFFDQEKIIKEVLFSEFEAILDNMAALTELAGQSLPAVYVGVDGQLNLQFCVFFLVSFDNEGYVVGDWDIPLKALVDAASPGPDLGQGPILLVSRNQCPAFWQDIGYLWEPTALQDTLIIIAHCMKANNLFLPLSESNSLHQVSFISTSKINKPLSSSEASLDEDTKNEYFEQIYVLQLQVERLEQAKKFLEGQVISLREQNEVQRAQSVSNQAAIEARSNLKLKDQEQQLKTKLKNKLEKALHNSEKKFTKEIQTLQKEFQVAQDKIKTLSEELCQLRKDKWRLVNSGGDKFLEQLDKLGVNFIAHHPGAGHISIPLSDMVTYMENPYAYAARRCLVDEDLYREWLRHFENNVCTAQVNESETCGERIPKVHTPREFTAGISDRCEKHKSAVIQMKNDLSRSPRTFN